MLEEKLGEGELDLAIYCKPEPLEERLHQLPLYAERFMIAVAPSIHWPARTWCN